MSGHSKWSSIKHKKAREDAKRGKVFSKLSKFIIVAAKEGAGDPRVNAALDNAIEKAKEANMPMSNIERAIKKGTGEIEGEVYEHILYEGYGPGGIALLIDVMTDNKNRAVADIRFVFEKYGGKLGSSGSVAWMFERKGVVLVNKSETNEDDLLLLVADAGAEDVTSEGEQIEVICDVENLENIKKIIKNEGIKFVSADITMLPKDTAKVEEKSAEKLFKLMDAIENQDDVQDIYSNFDIPNEIIEKLS